MNFGDLFFFVFYHFYSCLGLYVYLEKETQKQSHNWFTRLTRHIQFSDGSTSYLLKYHYLMDGMEMAN